MYGIEMKYTVKTLLERGKSLRAISRELGVNRKTITKIKDEIEKGNFDLHKIKRQNILGPYHEFVEKLIEKKLTSILIHRKLIDEKDLNVSYPTVLRYVNSFKQSEVYIPVETPPGEEAQVDFGYFGVFYKNGKSIKVWVFSMQLSYSRYAYYQIVTDQTTETFIKCHINAFEFFKGVPKTVKIDNLKSAVLEANFYEPVFQTQYSKFLNHYKSAPITARVRRGQDKGKVESGIKYVKNNFLKGLGHRNFEKLNDELKQWNIHICNKRTHGTTRKIPEIVYENIERKELSSLPQNRFEIYRIEKRKVKPNAHISFQYNYYSVPSEYANKEIIIKSNGTVIKIYDGLKQLTLHSIEQKQQGQYITVEAHKPPYKQRKSPEYYYTKASNIGEYVNKFFIVLKKEKPYQWHKLITGIFSLAKTYDKQVVNMACKRALSYKAYSYISVKNICKNGLYEHTTAEELSVINAQGFNHDLKIYDTLN